ncbi:MAG TPA: glutaminyl-peptide cyclotransferase [Chitinophagaceae bacterium]
MNIRFLLVCILSFVCFASCNNNESTSEETSIEATPITPQINYAITKAFPHDTSLFTEGLLFHNGTLYESTGSPDEFPFTKSLIITDDLSTGSFEKKVELDKGKYFGEGIVFLNNKLYQLTYKNQIGFIYDAKTFKQIGTFKYSNTEGWSLTTDGKSLIMSDGTNKLTYLSPKSLTPIKVLSVTDNNSPVDGINELEFIKGFIYANVWQTNSIVKIDTSNGKVVGKLDLSALVFEAKNKKPNADVLNGIAYDSIADKIYVTGKLWTNIYEINFTH